MKRKSDTGGRGLPVSLKKLLPRPSVVAQFLSSIGAIVFVVVFLSVLVALAMAAPDKYTLKVPNGLAFSEFRGYEAWQVVSISQDGKLIAAILANPVMVKAYLAGVPGNGVRMVNEG